MPPTGSSSASSSSSGSSGSGGGVPVMSRSVSRHRIWEALGVDVKERVRALALDIRQSGLVVDRKHRLTTHKNVIVGKEVAQWMVHTGRAETRQEAKELGQLLLVGDYVHHVTDDHEFEDKRYYYRFRADEKMTKGPSTLSLVKGARMEGWLVMRKGKAVLRMKRQYCVMSSGAYPVLYYFKDDLASGPSGFINFQKTKYRVRYLGSSPGKHAFQLNATSPDGHRVRIIAAAPDARQLQGWISAFVAAGAEFVENVQVDNTSIYGYTVFDAQDKPVCLDQYRGKVLMVVNMPCTIDDDSDSDSAIEEFSRLQALDEEYKSKGLRVIGFPCSHFEAVPSGQHNTEAMALRDDLDLHFDVMGKVCINGIHRHPLYAYLKARLPGQSGTFIGEDFTKFLITETGVSYGRHEPSQSTFAQLEEDLQALLKISRKPAKAALPPLISKPSGLYLTNGSPIRIPNLKLNLSARAPGSAPRMAQQQPPPPPPQVQQSAAYSTAAAELARAAAEEQEAIANVFPRAPSPGSSRIVSGPTQPLSPPRAGPQDSSSPSIQSGSSRKRRKPKPQVVISPLGPSDEIPSTSYFAHTPPRAPAGRAPPSYEFTISQARRSSLPLSSSSPEYQGVQAINPNGLANMSYTFGLGTAGISSGTGPGAGAAAAALNMTHDLSYADESFVEAVDSDKTQIWDHNMSRQFALSSFYRSPPQESSPNNENVTSPLVRSPVISENSGSPRRQRFLDISNQTSLASRPCSTKSSFRRTPKGSALETSIRTPRSFMSSGTSVRTTFV